MKNITLSADGKLIEAARMKAARERTTLNEEFRRWLTHYIDSEATATRAMRTIRELQKSLDTGGRHFSRDELNER